MSTFTSITEIIKQSLKTQKRRLTQFRNKLTFNIGHLEISASASWHQHWYWRRHRHCNFFFLSKPYFLPFENSYEIKHLWWSPFQISVETSLAPASEERNSAMDVISGVLKTRKAESCSLYVCVFLIRNHIRDHFLEIFCKSQNTFKKFG